MITLGYDLPIITDKYSCFYNLCRISSDHCSLRDILCYNRACRDNAMIPDFNSWKYQRIDSNYTILTNKSVEHLAPLLFSTTIIMS